MPADSQVPDGADERPVEVGSGETTERDAGAPDERDAGAPAERDGETTAGRDAESDLAPSDAFQALGGETRLAVVRALATADGPLAFSQLFAATDEDTSAGFAYHLRQLAGEFLRQRDDERYELTDAGRAAARHLRAGTYTRRVNRDPVAIDVDCPLCDGETLTARVEDNVTVVACEACDTTLSRLSLPPGGYADRRRHPPPHPDRLVRRRRVSGVCRSRRRDGRTGQ